VFLTFVLALIVNGFIAYLAVLRESVDTAGGAAGAVIGAAVLSGGGFWLWMTLIFFFATSSAFSSVGKERKRRLSQLHLKGSRRDIWQVLANGSVGGVSAVLYGATANPVFALACAAAFACAAADTWASEIGIMSRRKPVSIRTGKPVPPGLSGGISPLGTLAALFGSTGTGILFYLERLTSGPGLSWTSLQFAGIAAACGFLSSFIDSVLGATLQVHYVDEATDTESERSSLEGRALKRKRGVPWITNDTVNFMSILAGTLLSAAAYYIWL